MKYKDLSQHIRKAYDIWYADVLSLLAEKIPSLATDELKAKQIIDKYSDDLKQYGYSEEPLLGLFIAILNNELSDHKNAELPQNLEDGAEYAANLIHSAWKAENDKH